MSILDPISDDEIAEAASLNLYDAAMAVRAGRDGSGDPMEPHREQVIVRALRKRLAEWKPSRWPQRDRADAAMYELIDALLSELEAW